MCASGNYIYDYCKELWQGKTAMLRNIARPAQAGTIVQKTPLFANVCPERAGIPHTTSGGFGGF